jgi:hypothetical protein
MPVTCWVDSNRSVWTFFILDKKGPVFLIGRLSYLRFFQNNWQRDVGNAARDIERLYDCSAQTDGNREFLREAVAEISSSLSAPDDSAPIRTLSVLKKMLLDIGQIDSEDAVLRQLQQNTAFSCQRAISSLESTKKGRFDWCDSLVVRALLEGSWLLIDNANLCRLGMGI